jgi:hypothetical protein
MNGHTKAAEACCTTPGSMRYWAIVFFAVLAPLILISIYWHPLSGAAGALAAGIACLANWSKNRTYHCGISGPILIFVGAVLLSAGMRLIHVQDAIVWGLAGAGVVVSLILEWRYAKRARPNTGEGAGGNVEAPGHTHPWDRS